MTRGRIRIGVGGWTYEPWRGVFFPAALAHKDELRYASARLTSIEVDGTFYRYQTPDTFRKWYQETPTGFVFAFKAHRACTNRRLLAEAGEAVGKFLSSGVRELHEKLGPINWQLPPTKAFDATDVDSFFKMLPTDLKHALEVRHESFRCEAFLDLAREYNIAVVVSGDSEYPLIPGPTAPFVYLRIMGTVETEPLGYSESQLDAWAGRARTYATGNTPPDLSSMNSKGSELVPRDVYLYVISGFKQSNPTAAMNLISRL